MRECNQLGVYWSEYGMVRMRFCHGIAKMGDYKVLDMYWLDSIAKLSLFVMTSCLGDSWLKKASKEKRNFSCKDRLQEEKRLIGC